MKDVDPDSKETIGDMKNINILDQLDQILNQSLISPATCCLVNQDKEKTVEKAFQLTQKLSENLRGQYKLT